MIRTFTCVHTALLAVLYHDVHSDDKWNDDDVEIGRCLSRKVDTQCSSSAEVCACVELTRFLLRCSTQKSKVADPLANLCHLLSQVCSNSALVN